MTIYTGRDIFEGLKATRTRIDRERKEWQKMRSSLATSVSGIQREIDGAWAYLGEVVISSLHPGVLDDAAARLALPHISARNIAAMREKDRTDNLARIEAIERDPLFVEREGRRNAVQIRLAEVEDARAPLIESVSALRGEHGFEDLIYSGYATDDYTHRFWEASYYRHWKLADEIVERHGKRLNVEGFPGIRKMYLAESEALQPLDALRNELRRELEQIGKLEQAHAQAGQALETLDARALAWARGRVREHLGALAPDEMTKLLQLVPEWRVAGTRILGLLAKQAYLEEMHRQVVLPFDGEARAALSELDARIMKASRPKKWSERVDEATFEKRIGRRRVDKWSQRRKELEGARSSIESFDRYDRYDPTRDFVWWSLMTDGRYEMPFARRDDNAVFWGGDDDKRLAAASAGARARDDGSRDRDIS